ncbi:MAG: DUF4058 family protein, partial [Chloroflexota bacterium]
MKFDHNIFPGINPYAHHRALGRGWNDFHTAHINDIATTLQRDILSRGYLVEREQGLQLKKTYSNEQDVLQRRVADVLVSTSEAAPGQTEFSSVTVATAEMALTELLMEDEPEENLAAIAVFRSDSKRETPITWIELLSPANKPGGTNYDAYIQKRRELLHAGIAFVEIDYIHTRPPTFAPLAGYDSHQEYGIPYRIVVMNPHPDYRSGRATRYEFGVLARMPVVTIPLAADDTVAFDFSVPYQVTFDALFYAHFVDYSTPAGDMLGYHDA